MSGFINWECGGERRNSDSDFEDDGWRPRSGRDRGAARGRGANRRGRGGESKSYLYILLFIIIIIIIYANIK